MHFAVAVKPTAVRQVEPQSLRQDEPQLRGLREDLERLREAVANARRAVDAVRLAKVSSGPK
jgi:hypothetical protein